MTPTRSIRSTVSIALALWLSLPLGTSVWADAIRLSDAGRTGDTSHVQISFVAAGRLRGGEAAATTADAESASDANAADDASTTADSSTTTDSEVNFRVRARLTYEQRQLAGRPSSDSATSSSDSTQPTQRAARYYQQAQVALEVGGQREVTRLAPERRLVVAEATDSRPLLYSPEAPLTRAELELIDIPADSLVLPRLLPSEAVSPGSTWRHPDGAIAALLNLDQILLNECSSRLVETERGLALMEIDGTVRGRVDGVDTEVQLRGDYRFDLRWQRITWLQLRMTQQRDPGHAAPGYDTQSQLKVLITPLESPRHLTPQVDLLVQTAPGEAQLLLDMHCPTAGIRLLHDRRWHLLHARHQAAVMRMVDGGDMIAQCQLIKLSPLPAGKKVSLEQLQEDIQKTLGDKFVQVQEATEEPRRDGYHVLRVVVQGTVSDVPVYWVYYHVAGPTGHAISAVFTLDPKLEARFSESDRGLIASLEFVDRA